LKKLTKKYPAGGVKSKSPKSFLVMILLFIYSISVFQFDFQHQYLHQKIKESIHTQQAEKDICHLTIYHSSKADCHHKTHLNEAKSKCLLCDSHFSREYLAIYFSKFSFDKVAFQEYSFFSTSFLLDVAQNGHSRAPPFVV
jgi:hypothetical protein